MGYYVYILASRKDGAIYVGVTGDLVRRITQHKHGDVAGHTKRYGVNKLVYYEVFDRMQDALQREKNMKHWPRAYKTRLILKTNPSWQDLYDEIKSCPEHFFQAGLSCPHLSRASRSGGVGVSLIAMAGTIPAIFVSATVKEAAAIRQFYSAASSTSVWRSPSPGAAARDR